MAAEYPGWLTATEATDRYGISYTMLRKLVADGVFTRGQFSSAKDRPPIYLRVTELEAWRAGGVPAVNAVKSEANATTGA